LYTGAPARLVAEIDRGAVTAGVACVPVLGIEKELSDAVGNAPVVVVVVVVGGVVGIVVGIFMGTVGVVTGGLVVTGGVVVSGCIGKSDSNGSYGFGTVPSTVNSPAVKSGFVGAVGTVDKGGVKGGVIGEVAVPVPSGVPSGVPVGVPVPSEGNVPVPAGEYPDIFVASAGSIP
jgi:hypothetical protein